MYYTLIIKQFCLIHYPWETLYLLNLNTSLKLVVYYNYFNNTFNIFKDFLFFCTMTSSTTSSMLWRGLCLTANSGVTRNNGSHFFSSLSRTYFCASRIIGLGGLSSRSLPHPPPASATCSNIMNFKITAVWFNVHVQCI